MAREIEVGDIVRLASSDLPQPMLVNKLTTDGVECVWVSDFGNPYRELYQKEVLAFVKVGDAKARFKDELAPGEEPVTIDEETLPF